MLQTFGHTMARGNMAGFPGMPGLGANPSVAASRGISGPSGLLPTRPATAPALLGMLHISWCT